MRILSAQLLGCLILATAPLQAAAPPADSAAYAPQDAVQWTAKEMAGIWDLTLGEEGPDAFVTSMTLKFADDALSGSVNLGSDMDVEDLKWDKSTGTLSFGLTMGEDYAMTFTMTRDGDKLVGNLTDGDELDEVISASFNAAKTKAVADKAAAIARGEIVEGIEKGDRAPEITGTDLDGVDFKLSDYKGKIVMLDFWGDW